MNVLRFLIIFIGSISIAKAHELRLDELPENTFRNIQMSQNSLSMQYYDGRKWHDYTFTCDKAKLKFGQESGDFELDHEKVQRKSEGSGVVTIVDPETQVSKGEVRTHEDDFARRCYPCRAGGHITLQLHSPGQRAKMKLKCNRFFREGRSGMEVEFLSDNNKSIVQVSSYYREDQTPSVGACQRIIRPQFTQITSDSYSRSYKYKFDGCQSYLEPLTEYSSDYDSGSGSGSASASGSASGRR